MNFGILKLNLMRKVNPIKVLFFIMLAGIIILSLLLLKTCNKIDRLENVNNLYSSINDTLTQTRDSLGVERSRISILTSDRADVLIELMNANDEIQWLQREYLKYKDLYTGSITVISTQGNIIDSLKTVVTAGDTIVIGDTTYIFPTYSFAGSTTGKYNDQPFVWADYNGISTRNHTTLEFTYRDRYSIAIVYPKRKLFGKDEPGYAEVTSYNPHNNVETFRTYDVQTPKPKKLGLAIQVGYGIAGSGLSPYIGIGIGYNVIEIK